MNISIKDQSLTYQNVKKNYRYMWVIIQSELLKLIYLYSIYDITMQSTSLFVCNLSGCLPDALCMYLCLQLCLQPYTCLLQLVVLVCQHLHISIHFCSFCFSFFKFFQCLQLANNSTYWFQNKMFWNITNYLRKPTLVFLSGNCQIKYLADV